MRGVHIKSGKEFLETTGQLAQDKSSNQGMNHRTKSAGNLHSQRRMDMGILSTDRDGTDFSNIRHTVQEAGLEKQSLNVVVDFPSDKNGRN